jgi:hypothetical protein
VIKTSMQNLPPLSAVFPEFAGRAGNDGESPGSTLPSTVSNVKDGAGTSWLYLDAAETSNLGRKHRDSLSDLELDKLQPDERAALDALDQAIRAGRMSYLASDDSGGVDDHGTLRRRIHRIAGHLPQHGANPALMASLKRRLKQLPPPSGT